MKLGVSVSVVLVGLILLFGRYLMQLFTKTPEVIALGTRTVSYTHLDVYKRQLIPCTFGKAVR